MLPSATASVTDSLKAIQALLGKGRYIEAESSARDLLERVETLPTPDSLNVARVLDLLVVALWRQNKVADPSTRALGERAIAIKERILGSDDPDLAQSLFNVGRVLREAGNFAAAKPLLERALAIRERALGPSHPDVALSLNGLGFLLTQTGDYAGARPLLERALSIRERVLGLNDPELAQSLSSLGNLLYKIGGYSDAKALLERALAIREKVFGSSHSQVGISLFNLGALYFDMGDYAKARELDERALAILQAPGPRRAALMGNLAHVLEVMGDYPRAKLLAEGVLADAKSLGLNQWFAASAWENLGRVALATGDYAAAKSPFEQALAARSSLGTGNPFVIEYLQDLALVLLAMGDRSGATQYALRCEEAGREHLRLTCRTLPERQALRFATTRRVGLGVALSVLADAPEPVMVESDWDALVRSRAVVLDEMAARHLTLLAAARADSDIAGLVTKLASAEGRLANLMVHGAGDDPLEGYRRLLDETRDESEEYEKELADKSVKFRTERAMRSIGLKDVAAALPPRSALVSFVRFDRYYRSGAKDPDEKAGTSSSDSSAQGASSIRSLPHYLALIMRAGDPQPPAVTQIGSAQEIDSLVSRWAEEVRGRALGLKRPERLADSSYRRAGEALRRAVWDPIAPRVSGVERVFIVPDGELHLVNFASLPTEPGKFLVETGPLIHLLSAERDLVRADPSGNKRGGLLVLGGPDFDEKSTFAALAPSRSPRRNQGHAFLASASPYRGERSGCGDFRSLRFGPLPGTVREGRAIVALWGKTFGAPGEITGRPDGTSRIPSPLVLTGSQATESEFKQNAPRFGVLHLATHGFFLGGQCHSALEGARGVTGLVVAAPPAAPDMVGENPLLLSGLVLAGANHRGAAGPNEDDGILTAEEIAALDLSGVQWAVLSACETGMGEVRAGEGVLGLRRAFQVAGASTLIMSLWSVEDEATRAWMRALYEARLVRRLGTAEAVRAASLEVLKERRAQGKSTHPFYWGAFVAAGDWN